MHLENVVSALLASFGKGSVYFASKHIITITELRYAALTLMNIERGFQSLIKK